MSKKGILKGFRTSDGSLEKVPFLGEKVAPWKLKVPCEDLIVKRKKEWVEIST